jgi:hypothetical protein
MDLERLKQARDLIDAEIAAVEETIERNYRTGLNVRPPDDAPGWEDQDIAGPLGLILNLKRITADNGLEWVDYPAPPAGHAPDEYWIRKGVYDVTAPIWNGRWFQYDAPTEIQEWFIANYKGGTRAV